MKEVSVGLSDANAEEAASMEMACRRERRVASLESLYKAIACRRKAVIGLQVTSNQEPEMYPAGLPVPQRGFR